MSHLVLSDVCKVYDANRRPVTAVDDLDLTIEQGEVVALLGSSGCGKTSTLRMIAGFEAVTRGRITLAGREIQQLAPARRGVAMAFEGYSLYPPLTVRENIGFALRSAGVHTADIDRRVREMADMLEMGSILDRYPSSISGGQQQRASLARALIREANLHLLDEPMGQLEPQLRALLRGRIKHFLKEQGRTAILVTHDQTEANALADRIAVMEAGVLQQFASPEQLRERPANLFTGTFIGEPPMNVIEADVRIDSRQIAFGFGEGAGLAYPRAAVGDAVSALLERHPTISIGVRPHVLGLSGAAGDAATVQAQVLANQWLGDQSHVATDCAGTRLVAVEHQRVAVARGETVQVHVSVDDLHLFDSHSGRALAHGRDVT